MLVRGEISQASISLPCCRKGGVVVIENVLQVDEWFRKVIDEYQAVSGAAAGLYNHST